MVTTPTKDQLNLRHHSEIELLDLSVYDVVINCAGFNVGTYQGFYKNPTANQIEQIDVNFIGPLMLAKNYSQSNPQGHFVYISSGSIDNPYLYNLINSTSKAALRFSMDILRKNLRDFTISEICPGKTKTNMLKQNYNGTKTDQDIEDEYDQNPHLTTDQVADAVLFAIRNRIDVIKLSP